MNKGHAKSILMVGFSMGALSAAEAAQTFGAKTSLFSTFRETHPVLMLATHIIGILLVLGVFAIVLAGVTRGPSDL